MATAKKTAAKSAAKPAKPAAKPVAPKAKPTEDHTPIEAHMAQYTPEDLVKIDTLKAAGVTLDGTEDAARLDAMLLSIEESGDTGEAEDDADLPRKMAPRFEIVEMEGVKRKLGIHFIHSANAKSALYNEFGVRISPAYGQDDVLAGSENSSSPTKALGAIRKMAARNNAERRRTHRAADLPPA